MSMPEIIFILSGLLMGLGIMYVFMRLLKGSKHAVLEERISGLQNERENLSKELAEKGDQIMDLNARYTTSLADIKHASEKLETQKKDIEQIQELFREKFENLANSILEDKTKKFTEVNRVKLEEILNPLKDRIRDFEKKVEETYDKEAQQRFSLKEEVKNLAELNRKVSEEAQNLTKALKGESKTQGNWGEMILESILEKSGLVKGREYSVQPSFRDESGKLLYPDVIVHYPENRNVVIDSKVSLTAYEAYTSSDDPEVKDKLLREHLASIRKHVNELESANYQDLYSLQSLDFVMMFLPIEPAYLLAIQKEPELWNFAYEKRVLLISPTNLIAALKMIAALWQQDYQNKNVMEIARQAGDLIDKFHSLLEDLDHLDRDLKSARDHYDDAKNKLSEGKGNLIRRVEKIKELGVKSKKKLPKSFSAGISED
jgi:DNA recombination protein RmuC